MVKREIYKQCGITMSEPKVKKRIRKNIGKRTRLTFFASKSLSAITEAVLRQIIREAGQFTKKRGKGDDTDPILRAEHLAKGMCAGNSVVKGSVPDKVAGVYTSTFKK